MPIKLRPYQEEAYECTLEKFKTVDSALCVLATSLGKTIIAAHLVEHFRKTGRIMMIAHREELITQAQDKIESVTGCIGDIEMGEQWAASFDVFKSDVVVSTVQTQIAGRDGGRMTRFDPNEFSLLITDEAHHSVSASWMKVILYYMQNPKLKVLGLTATPDRLDKKAMGQIFQEVAYKYDIEDGIRDGWLVGIDQQSKYLESLDYSGVGTSTSKVGGKDLNGKDMAAELEREEIPHAMVDGIMQFSGDKKTLVFAQSIVQAGMMTEIFNRPNRKPGSARFVCGTTNREIRRQIVIDYTAGNFQYLVNVGCFTEGYDEPGIRVIADCAPTLSRLRFTQKLGRGTRVLTELNIDQYETAEQRREAIFNSDKPSILFIDFVGNSGQHKLICPTDILGGDYSVEVIELAKENAAKKSDETNKPVNIASELQKAEREIAKRHRDKEDAIARDHLLLRAKYSTAKINPFNVLDIDPHKEATWHEGRAPTPGQRKYLEKCGVPIDGLTFTHASQIIDTMIKRREAGTCTYKMAKCLQKFGFDTTNMDFKKAGITIGALSKVGWQKWRLPKNLQPQSS